MNGFEVQTRFTEAAISVPVIVITGHDTEESRCRALKAGAFAYLRKPVDDAITELDVVRTTEGTLR